MESRGLPFHEVLRLLLDDTGIRASALAAALGRERSLVYKWLSGAHLPRPSCIPELVKFFCDGTTQSQKAVLTGRLSERVERSALPAPVKGILLSKAEDFHGFLEELLSLSMTSARRGSGEDGANGKDLPAGSARAKDWLSVCAWGALSAVAGGALWNLANRLCGWTYYMGALEAEPAAAWPFLWGMLTALPVILVFLFAFRIRRPLGAVLPALLYAVTGGVSAAAFYRSGLRPAFEALGLNDGPQEILIAFVYALIVSVPPYVAAGAYFRPRLRAMHAACALIPAVSAVAAVSATLVIGVPAREVLQLRGFLVGIAIRTSMFFALAASFRGIAPSGADRAAARFKIF